MFASPSTLSLVLHTTRATRKEKRMLYLINGRRRELKLGKVTALPVVHACACNCSNVGNEVSNLGSVSNLDVVI